MECCLLCLEINKCVEDCIKVNSSIWQELNIQTLIEKHLWPQFSERRNSKQDIINSSSLICTTCWQELYDFHKFYMRIEEAHMNFGTTVKPEINPELRINFENNHNKEYLYQKGDPLYKNEILMEPFLPLGVEIENKKTTFIKEEPLYDLYVDDALQLKGSKMAKETTVLPNDPLKETTNPKQIKNRKKRKKTKDLFLKSTSIELSNDKTEIELFQTKQDKDTLKISNDIDTRHKNFNDEIINDSSIVNVNKEQKSSHKFPETNKEKDEFLAKNLKMSCILCEQTMETFPALCKHFQVEHNQSGYVVCCKKKFSSRSILVDHVHGHLNPDHFKCNHCSRVMSDHQSLEKHIKTKHINNIDWHNYCNICGDGFANISELKTHKLIHNLQKNPAYKLPESNEEKDAFLAKNYKISCILCDQPMETFDILCKHFKAEHNQPGYVICCNKKFCTRSILVDHVHCHLNPDHFKCSHCGKIMSDRQCLEKHIKKLHVNNVVRNHYCEICGKGFTDSSGLRLHKLVHLPEEEKKFPCTECGKNFANNSLLSQHVRFLHLKKYSKVCDICGKTIRYANLFKRHMLEHEGKPLSMVSCDTCGRRLIDNNSLKRHKKIHHSGKKQEHGCHICLKTLTNIYSLRKHINSIHEKGYDQKCTICQKTFNRPQALRDHMARHAGTALHSCPWCTKSFYSNGHMHAHRKKDHPKEWEDQQREKFSGNLPPNYKPHIVTEINNDVS